MPRWLPKPLKRAQFRILDAVIDHSFAPTINALHEQLDLPPVENIASGFLHSPDLVIGLWPDWFAPKQPDWPPKTLLAGFNVQEHGEREPSESLKKFLHDGAPPVVFTIGSGMGHGRAFYQTSADICREIGCRGILVSRFPDQLPAQLPPGVIHVEYVPYNRLLPKSSAVVHHAGIGTAAQALAAAIPQLCLPGLVFDTFDTAVRLENLGVGASIPLKKYSVPAAAPKLRQLLVDPTIKSRCIQFAQKVQADNAIQIACNAIESLIKSHEKESIFP